MNNPTVKKALHFLVFLLVLGIICGGVLALVNSFTAPVIAERKQREVQQQLEAILGTEYNFNVQEKPAKVDGAISDIYALYDKNNNKIGVIYKTSTNGYGGEIIMVIGITFANDEILVHKVVSANETAGISDPFNHNFGIVGSTVDNYNYTPQSGATITGKAVLEGVEASINNYKANKGFFMGE